MATRRTDARRLLARGATRADAARRAAPQSLCIGRLLQLGSASASKVALDATAAGARPQPGAVVNGNADFGNETDRRSRFAPRDSPRT